MSPSLKCRDVYCSSNGASLRVALWVKTMWTHDKI
jgi:hypothetical protein